MKRSLHYAFKGKWLAALMLLSACSGYHGSPVFSSDSHVGVYKVGDPYEINGQWYTPKVDEDYDETGVASWYGSDFHNKLTANGDLFDKNALTAAHKTLPLPSMVRVTNAENGRTLIVMVNDRGPFSNGRLIDLSERAADILGFKGKGLAKVRVQFLPGQTRRLLAQLDAPKGNMNPFATANANFDSHVEQPPFVKNAESEAMRHMPLPAHMNIELSEDASLPDSASALVKNNASDAAPMEVAPLGEQDTMWSVFAKPANAAEIHIQEIPAKTVAVEPKIPHALPRSHDVPIAAPVSVNDATPSAMIAPQEPVQDVMMVASLPETEAIQPEKVMLMEKDEAIEESLVGENDVVLPKDSPHYVHDIYYVQAGAFRIEDNAMKVSQKLAIIDADVKAETVQLDGDDLFKVRMGPLYDERRAKLMLRRVVKMGYADAIMVTESKE